MKKKNREKKFDHHRRLFHETDDLYYYIHSKGYVESYPKPMDCTGIKSSLFERVEMKLYSRPTHKSRIFLGTMVDGKRVAVKKLVAQYFSKEYKQGSKIILYDGDPSNCRIENLIILPPKTKLAGNKGKKISIKVEGRWQVYDNINDAARKLHLSHSTIKRYIRGITNRIDPIFGSQFEYKFIEHNEVRQCVMK